MATTKTPALSTRLKKAQEQIAELEKKLKQAEDNKKYSSDRADSYGAELDGVHDVLDSLEGAPARQDEKTYRTRSASVRLAAYFAGIANRRG